jgi:hypothetical protein
LAYLHFTQRVLMPRIHFILLVKNYFPLSPY